MGGINVLLYTHTHNLYVDMYVCMHDVCIQYTDTMDEDKAGSMQKIPVLAHLLHGEEEQGRQHPPKVSSLYSMENSF